MAAHQDGEVSGHGTFVVFAIIVFTVWAEGWGTGSLNTAKAPAASQHRTTTGSAPKNP
jgi:hypothetical protein